jgi:hypothetical protein
MISDNAYWKKHLSHLEKLINSLHPHSQAPLLLVFPTNGNDAEINQTVRLAQYSALLGF